MGWLSDSVDAPASDRSNLLSDSTPATDANPVAPSLRLAQDITPDKAAQVLRLSDNAGLPTDFVSRNADALQKLADNAAVTPQFSQDHPITSGYMAEDPHQAAVVGPDASTFGAIERQFGYMANQTERGALDVERQFRGMLQGFGYEGPENDARIQHINARLEGDLNQEAPGPISNVFGKAVESAPLMVGALGIGALASAASLPAAAAAAGTAATFGALGFGNSFLDFVNRKDAQGAPMMSPDEARGFAAISGTLNGAMFMVPAGKLLEKIPALKMLAGDGVKSLISSPSALEALRGVAADIGKSAATMGGFSGLSSLVHSVAGHLGEIKGGKVQPGSVSEVLSTLFPPEDIKAAVQSGASGAVTGGIFGAAEGGIEAGLDHRQFTKDMNLKDLYYANNYLRAYTAKSGWDNISAALQSTKMSEIAPEQVDKLVSRMTDGQHVYIPLDQWQTYWQQQKVDPRATYLGAVGNTKAYDESLRTGADLQIPAGKYAASIASSDHAEFFNQHLRADPLAMSAEDASKSVSLTKELEQEQEKTQAANKIKDAAMNIPEPLPATEKEPITPAPDIKTAMEQQGIAALFPRPTAEGMNPDFAGKYRAAVDRAGATSQEEYVRDFADQANREKSRAWLIARKKVEDEVDKDSWNHKEFVAQDVLSRPIQSKQVALDLRQKAQEKYEFDKQQWDIWREILRTKIKPSSDTPEAYDQLAGWMKDPSGRGADEVAQEARERGVLGENEDIFQKLRSLERPKRPSSLEDYIPQALSELNPVKLKRSLVEADYPNADLSKMKGMFSDAVGVHPDQAAMQLGFNSGAELMHALRTTPDRDAWVQEETDRRMVERHTDETGGNIIDKAMDAVHNKDRSKVLHMELQHLVSDDFAAFKGLTKKIARPVPTVEEVRSDAKSQIDAKVVGETDPRLYQRQEALSSREALDHFLRGDFEKAFESKKQELLNHELYRSAKDAKDEAAKIVAFAKRYDSDSARARLGKAGGSYLEQMDAIRNTFDFSKISDKGLEKVQSLRDFLDTQREAGYSPVIPDDLLDMARKRSWKELSNQELQTVGDSMKNIAHIAGLKNKLLASPEQRTFDELRSKIADTLTDRFQLTPEKINKPFNENPSYADKFKTDMNYFGAWLTRFEPLFKSVGLHDEFYGAINEAENFKTSEMRKAYSHLTDMLSDYSNVERSRFGRTEYIPELEGTGLDPNRSKISILMSLLHAGNEGNLKELMRGYGLNEEHLQAMWKTLDAKDLTLAQNVWDFIGSYKDQIGKQERELNGIEPEWIQGKPFDVTLKDGSIHHLEGSYFPLVYDKNVSWRTAALQSTKDLGEMFPSLATNTATRHNWTKARVGGGGQAPSLNWSVFTNHVSDVIHDLAYRKPVIDLHKIINDQELHPYLDAGLGKGVTSQLNPWLKKVAGDRQWSPLGPLEGLRTLANNMTVAELGIKAGSAMVHMTSILPAAREVGLKYMAQGFKQFQNPENATKWMWDNSEFMRSRWQDTGDRDIRASLNPKLLNSQKGFLSELKAMSPISTRDAFILMRCADISVAGPTWYSAYFKAMDGNTKGIEANDHDSAVAYADQLVRDTKGSGSAKDLAPIQTTLGPIGKLFTMFQTQLNVIANQMMNASRDYKVDRNIGKLAGAVMTTWIGPAIAAQALRGHFPGSDEGWLKWGMKATAKFPFEVNPATAPFVRYLENPKDKLTLLPVEEALSTMVKTGLNVATKNPITDKATGNESEWTAKDYRDAFMSLGYYGGVPTRQIMQSALRLHGWMSGEEPHDNPIGGLYSVLTGSKPKE